MNSAWTAARIEQVLAECGVTVTRPQTKAALEYLASRINENAAYVRHGEEMLPVVDGVVCGDIQTRVNLDNVVVWKPGWPLSTITVDKEGPQ